MLIISNMKKTMINEKLVVAVTFAKNDVATILVAKPPITRNLGPYLSKIRPLTIDMIPLKIPLGNKSSPDFEADKPSPACMNSGKIMFEEKIIKFANNVNRIPSENIGCLNTSKCKTGSSMRSCRKIYSKSAIEPTAKAIHTIGPANPSLSPAKLKPDTMPPKPRVDKMIDKTSIFCFWVVEIFGKKTMPNSNARTRIGAIIQKIICQSL